MFIHLGQLYEANSKPECQTSISSIFILTFKQKNRKLFVVVLQEKQ
jgi:hypothetical protein